MPDFPEIQDSTIQTIHRDAEKLHADLEAGPTRWPLDQLLQRVTKITRLLLSTWRDGYLTGHDKGRAEVLAGQCTAAEAKRIMTALGRRFPLL